MNCSDLAAVLMDYWHQGLELYLKDGQLRFKAPQAVLQADTLDFLKSHKAAIMQLLTEQPSLYSGFDLSEGQRGIYLMQQMASQSNIYHQSALFQLHAALDIAQLKDSVSALLAHFPELTVGLAKQQDGIKQLYQFGLEAVFSSADIDGDIQPYFNQLADAPFDLHHDALLRIHYIRQQNHAYLAIVAHHIIADFWAMQQIMQSLESLYLQHGLPTLSASYKDHVLAEKVWLNSAAGQEAKAYWLKQLSPAPALLSLPYDFPVPAKASFVGQELRFCFEQSLSDQLKAAAQAEKVTPFIWLLSLYQLLLHRYSGESDIAIGVPFACRTSQAWQQLAGHFSNPVVLRQQLNGQQSFQQLLQNNKQRVHQAQQYQSYPLQCLVEELNHQAGQQQTLFQVAISWNHLDEQNKASSLIKQVQVMQQRGAIYPLLLSIYDNGQSIAVHWRFNCSLYKASTIKRYQQHLHNALLSSLQTPQALLPALAYLSQQEIQLSQAINQTQRPIPRQINIAELFRQKSQQLPQHIAFRDVLANTDYSYQALDAYSNQIAHFLHQQGLQAGDVIGLCLGRCYDNIACLLACLKSQIIYIPIDPENPQERVQSIVDSAQARALISHNDYALKPHSALVISLQASRQAIAQMPQDYTIAQQGHVDDDAIACIFFTSGSTGTPKGVEIPHRAIVRLTHNTNFAQVHEDDRVCHICNVGFDASNVELWFSLLHGACLLYLPNEQLLNAPRFADFVKQEKPTVTVMTTALFNLFVQYQGDIFKHFRYVMFGGEAADANACNRCIEHGKPDYLYNVYGPTENGTYSSVYLYENVQQGPVPIGFVVSNSQAYVLDQYEQIAPIGVTGELVVGGDGVATGYYRQPELSAKQFLADTFRGHGLLYKTGDLACLREDGLLMYQGRADEQIKLRGFRIETQEIEQQILLFAPIEQCHVGLVQPEAYLAAWFSASAPVDIGALKQFLAERLPGYMRPSAFVLIEQLPLTANGKVDKKALPAPQLDKKAHYRAPSKPLEQALQTLWQTVFAIDDISVDDDFFDLGGHSLLASRLCSAIQSQLNLTLTISDIFQNPSISALASELNTHSSNALPSLQARPEQCSVSASLSQKRLWFLQQLNPKSNAYNMPLALVIKKPIKATTIEQAIKRLMARHDVLRCAFIDKDGEAWLQESDIKHWQLGQLDLSQLNTQQANQHIHTQLDLLNQQAFDLKQAPLIKALLIQLAGQQVLGLCLHHIAVDGLSVALLLQDFASLLKQHSLPEKSLQYQDFSYWQQEQLERGLFATQLHYWTQTLADAPAFLNLPCDKTRPDFLSGQGAEIIFSLDSELIDTLKQLAKTQQISLFMLLIGAFSLLLSRYSGENALCVGFPVAGRRQAAVEDMVGLFVNNLSLYSQIDNDSSIEHYLQQVKQSILQALAHQDLPFNHIIEALPVAQALNYTPYLQASFSLEEHTLAEQIALALGDDFAYFPSQWQIAKYDINLACYKKNDGSIEAHFEYSTDLFEPASIERLAAYYRQLLSQIAENSQAAVKSLYLTSAQELQQLAQWNETHHTYPHYASLQAIIEQQAQKTPDVIAVSDEQQQLTYRSLEQQANQLAQFLLAHYGQVPAIGLCLQRSCQMSVALLAILKAGAAYVPFDPSLPLERLRFMAQDTQVPVILSHQAVLADNALSDLPILDLDHRAWQNSPNQRPEVAANTLFNIIYTSGSTGKPKGVMVTQQGIINRLQWMQKAYPIGAGDKILQKTPYSFDVSVWELFWPLMQGSQCVFAQAEGHKDPIYLRDTIIRQGISTLHFVPSMLAIFLNTQGIEQCHSLRQVFCSGEALQKEQVALFFHRLPEVKLYNLYGPTEASVDVSYYACSPFEPHSSIPIGKPIDNMQLYVLDNQLRQQPIGLMGDLYLAGIGLAQGYLNRPELNQQSFIDNPFGQGKLYKTGDVARFLNDGNIEYLGRSDRQIKLRGQRLELGEIEAALKQLPDIRDAIVKAHSSGSPEDTQLIAYVLSDAHIDSQILRQQLAQHLPSYMLPAYIMPLAQWPLSANGKLDQKALPLPEAPASSSEYIAPRNDTEQTLSHLWSALLGIENIGIYDNFFELGGHSLLATKLAAQIRNELQCSLELRLIFENPTIESLATVILAQQIEQAGIDAEELEKLLEQYDK